MTEIEIYNNLYFFNESDWNEPEFMAMLNIVFCNFSCLLKIRDYRYWRRVYYNANKRGFLLMLYFVEVGAC